MKWQVYFISILIILSTKLQIFQNIFDRDEYIYAFEHKATPWAEHDWAYHALTLSTGPLYKARSLKLKNV